MLLQQPPTIKLQQQNDIVHKTPNSTCCDLSQRPTSTAAQGVPNGSSRNPCPAQINVYKRHLQHAGAAEKSMPGAQH